MKKKLENKMVIMQYVDIMLGENWETEDDIRELANEYGYEIVNIIELPNEGNDAIIVDVKASISVLIDGGYIYEEDGKYFNIFDDSEIK